MKKTNFFKYIMVLFVFLFGGICLVNAADSLPSNIVTVNELREVEYIKNFPVIVKQANNGKYYVYCMNMSATYDKNITFYKTDVVDDGFIYILNNRPNTGDKDKDFYITQMAVWYYDDYLNNNNFNLVEEVKKYILGHMNTETVSKEIYKLYDGAVKYKKAVGEVKLGSGVITFTKNKDYFVSSEITISTKNLTGISYSLEGAPAGSLIVKKDNGNLVVKIPTDRIPEGKEAAITLNVTGKYTDQKAYYYFATSKYQKLLFQDTLDATKTVTDSVKMVVQNKVTTDVNISKTDITQTNEVAGATLVVKDESGKVIDTWVSTNKTHKITLTPGKYTLSETIAPEGYKLSTTTIEFMVAGSSEIYVKVDGKYTLVEKVIMINELLDNVGIRKLDKNTNNYVSGAKLVVKDEKGNVVKEFTSSNNITYLELKPGKYTLSEKEAPKGYLLSNEVIYFSLDENGCIKVKNNKGEYTESNSVTFYNTKEEVIDVPVPDTDASSTLLVISGIALLIGGMACVKKTIKEC